MKNYQNILLKKIRVIVQRYCKIAADEVRQRWSGLDTIDGDAAIEVLELEITQDTIVRALCAYGQKAWIAEFGKGSLMDNSESENPFLSDYLSSDGFNEDRLAHGLSVVGRPHGEYYDLDGEPKFSHGSLSGVPIEEWYGQRLFSPVKGQHIIRNILQSDGGVIDEMNQEIQDAISDVFDELLKTFPKEIRLC